MAHYRLISLVYEQYVILTILAVKQPENELGKIFWKLISILVTRWLFECVFSVDERVPVKYGWNYLQPNIDGLIWILNRNYSVRLAMKIFLSEYTSNDWRFVWVLRCIFHFYKYLDKLLSGKFTWMNSNLISIACVTLVVMIILF